MSSFFELPPPPPELPPEPPRRPWVGAGEDAIGRTVALNLMIGRSAKAALWIPAATVYVNGFEFDIELRYRFDDEEVAFEHPFHYPHPARRRQRRPEEGLSPGLLRFGIQFSDSRKATNLGREPFPTPEQPDESPEGPVLLPRGGGGGGGRWRQNYWVWPLPPKGPLTFVSEWPVADIPETRTEINSALVLEAAADAVVLWPEAQPPSGSGSWTNYGQVVLPASPQPPESVDPDTQT